MLLTCFAVVALAQSPVEPEPLDDLNARVDREAQATALSLGQWGADRERVVEAYEAQVAERLGQLEAAGVRYSPEELDRKVFAFERFKMERYVSSGVFPKRYFGYLDAEGDTAAHEVTMMATARGAVGVINPYLKAQGVAWRVTEAEVLVTFISEGGALMLGERQELLEGLHPIMDIGLDDIAHGSAELGELMGLLDAGLGTDLGGLVVWRDGEPSLTRQMSYEEAVAGTAMMWVWEKRIAARKLKAEGRAPLEGRDLETQFILSSLVYNSGLLFSDGRVAQLRAFSTGDYLAEVSRKNEEKRWSLNLLAPKELAAELTAMLGYRAQPTSWATVYHVLQRWGGYKALTEFTELFDEAGALRELPELPSAPAPTERPPTSGTPAGALSGADAPSAGCSSAPGVGARGARWQSGARWGAAGLLALGVALRRRRRATSSGSRRA